MNERLTEILSKIRLQAQQIQLQAQREILPRLNTLIASRGNPSQEEFLIRLKVLSETLMGWSFRTLEKVIPARNLAFISKTKKEEEEVASDVNERGEEISLPETSLDAPSDDVEIMEESYESSYIENARRWRWVAIVEGVALIVMMVSLVCVASSDRLVPYVVEIGSAGSTLAAHSARQASTVSQDVVAGQLGNFIVNARSVVSDPVIQKRDIDAVYGIVTGGAKDYIGDWYSTKGQSPYELSEHQINEVQILYVKPIAPPSYEISWTETIRAKDAKVHDSMETWAATVSVIFRPQSDEGSILSNPLGLYITALNWQKKL